MSHSSFEQDKSSAAREYSDHSATILKTEHQFSTWTVIWFLFLVTTLFVGFLLRLVLAGRFDVESLHFPFRHWRHAHSHLGYYGVIFPLLFFAWARRGGKKVSANALYLYLAASLLGFVGFASSGYALPSIIGSSVVGIFWIVQSIRQRGFIFQKEGFSSLKPVPISLLLACCFVPPIAIFTRRDPYFAKQLVHTFLGILLMNVSAPTVWASLSFRALPLFLSSWGSFFFGLISALYFGILPHFLLSVGPIALGLIWGAQIWDAQKKTTANASSNNNRLDVKLALSIAALGLIMQGFLPAPLLPLRSIAGIHFLILGPLLMGLVRERWPQLPLSLGFFWLGTVSVLAGSLWLASVSFAASWALDLHLLSALSGLMLLAISWVAVFKVRQGAPVKETVKSRG